MRQYRIFLGSSIMEPVSYDRCAIGNFIRKVNDALRDAHADLYIRLFLCELEDPSITPGVLRKKQEDYDRFICEEADLFLNLYGAHVGAFTRWELQLARQNLSPEDILVMFRNTETVDDTVTDLQAELTRVQQNFGHYAHIDGVKLAVTEWLSRKEPQLPVRIDGSQIRIGEKTVLRAGQFVPVRPAVE